MAFQSLRGLRRESVPALCVGALLLLTASVKPAFAVYVDPSLAIPTELLSFGPIEGSAFLPMPRAAATSTLTGAPDATTDGYGWVNSNISMTLSTQRQPPGTPSLGQAYLGIPFDPSDPCGQGGRSGNLLNGDTVCVRSFLDLSFDIAITDIDSTASFYGLPSTLSLIEQHQRLQQTGTCIADVSKPNLGCLPAAGAFIGFFTVVLDRGVDINGNDASDVIKLAFEQLQVGSVTNTFMQGTNIIDTFNSAIPGIGLVEDVSDDPPFSFTLTGPTVARQGIVYEVSSVPEPATLALLGLGLAGFGFSRRRTLN